MHLATNNFGIVLLAALAGIPPAQAHGVQASFGGQYRINAYSADNDLAGTGDPRASRLRLRQNIDLKLDPQFQTHLQIELGHTTDNISTPPAAARARRA